MTNSGRKSSEDTIPYGNSGNAIKLVSVLDAVGC